MNGNWLFPLLVTQTLQVTLLAGVVLGLSKVLAKDRPHLAHALWALVLLKCLTPPIIASPTSVFSWLSNGYTSVVSNLESPPSESDRSKIVDQPIEGIAPLVVRASVERTPNDRGESLSAQLVTADGEPRYLDAIIETAIYVWIAIAGCILSLGGLRLGIFLRRVKIATLPASPSLDRLVENVAKRIGLRRKVRIRTVDAAIGPAVVGLIRPTILLPKVIVEGKSDAELAPLLAHELIHVRRGDLVWAMLQGLSVSLWWFNPLIWLAERLLTREAERSCDEEAIAGLGCSPAMYARSLLDVMERKHQLRAAPSLPGVRPVDITAKRLERIMRLGHGCYRQRPWWVVAVWLMGCAAVLPGAAWVVGQEKPKVEPGVFKEAGFESEKPTQGLRLPRARFLVEGDLLAEPKTKSFEIGSLVADLCEEQGLSRAVASNLLVELLRRQLNHLSVAYVSKQTATGGVATSRVSSVYNAEGTGPEATSNDTAPALEISGDQLHVRATDREMEQIERSVEHFRKFGFKSFVTTIQFYEVSRPVILDEDAFQNGKLAFELGAKISSNLGVSEQLSIRNVGVFDQSEVTKFKHGLEQQKDTVCVSSPRITSLSGQRASVQHGETRNFTLDYKRVKAADGTIDYQPVHDAIQTGMHCEIRVSVAKPANEGDEPTTEVSIQSRHTNIKSVSTSKKTFSDTAKEFTIEFPIAASATFETTCRFKLDQSLVAVQWHENKTLITIVNCKPTDKTVALAPPAVISQLDKPAYVTVSDAQISSSEIAQLRFIFAKLGISDFRIDGGCMQVNITEDWKAAVNAFQELRASRNSSAASSTLTANAERKFLDNGTGYVPVPIFGPLIHREALVRQVPMLSKLPYINRLYKNVAFTDETEQSKPTDEEIIRALEKQSNDGGLSEAFYADQIKIKTSLISSFGEPVRFVPLVGEAVLHHSHYKCLLHDAKTGALLNEAYVDYCQFVLQKEAAKDPVSNENGK